MPRVSHAKKRHSQPNINLAHSGKYPWIHSDVLSHDEILDLIRRFQESNDESARNRLVVAHIALVLFIAKKYAHCCGESFDPMDLVHEGIFGLIRGLEKFDLTRGSCEVASFVWWHIRAKIVRHIRWHKRLIRFSENHIAVSRVIKHAINALQETLYREPTASEIAAHLGISEVTIQTAVCANRTSVVYLDQPMPSYGGRTITLHETVAHEDVLDSVLSVDVMDACEEVCLELRSLLNGLGELVADGKVEKRDARIFLRRNAFDLGVQPTLSEVGKEYGLTRERVRQIVRDVWKKLAVITRKGVCEKWLEEKMLRLRVCLELLRADPCIVVEHLLEETERFLS